MNVTSYGCSFIFGSDLSDAHMIPGTTGQPSKHTWPALVAQALNANYCCRALPGCGNLLIAERIFQDIAVIRHMPNPLVIVGWTWLDRFDYRYPNQHDGWNTIRPVDTSDLAQHYYKNLHSEYCDKLTALITIKSVIDSLLQNNIKFIMTYMDTLLLDHSWHTSQSIKFLQNCVGQHMTLFEDQTFLNWSRSKHFPESAGWHPLEQAHQAAANVMLEVFDKQNTNGPVQQVLS